MRALDLTVRPVPAAGRFSRVHAIAWDAAAERWWGGADPDWEGSARGPDEEPAPPSPDFQDGDPLPPRPSP